MAIELSELTEDLIDLLVISVNDRFLRRKSRCHENISKTDKIVNTILIATETETAIGIVIDTNEMIVTIETEIISVIIIIQINSTEKGTIRSQVCRSLDMPNPLMNYTMIED